jgi:hypothetical protein
MVVIIHRSQEANLCFDSRVNCLRYLLLFKKKERRDQSAAPETPTKGHQQTAPGPTPRLGAVVPSTALLIQEPRYAAQVGRFSESRLDARASIKLYSLQPTSGCDNGLLFQLFRQCKLTIIPAHCELSVSIVVGKKKSSPRGDNWLSPHIQVGEKILYSLEGARHRSVAQAGAEDPGRLRPGRAPLILELVAEDDSASRTRRAVDEHGSATYRHSTLKGASRL